MLPFGAEEFFQVFAAYNTAIWPAQVVVYALSGAALWAIFRRYRSADRFALTLLGGLWLWNGLLYHLAFFSTINPIAPLFAALFVVQGVIFFLYARKGGVSFAFEANWRGVAGVALIAYAMLIYEAIGSLLHGWPRAPLFGVAPCPTTIFSAGLLLLAKRPLPASMVAIPVLWSGIGATAAWLLSVPEDLALLAGGAVLLLPPWKRAGCLFFDPQKPQDRR